MLKSCLHYQSFCDHSENQWRAGRGGGGGGGRGPWPLQRRILGGAKPVKKGRQMHEMDGTRMLISQ